MTESITPKPEIRAGHETDPFAPSLNIFFPEIHRRQRLDLIFTLIGYGRTPVVLVAPLGAGKSTLLAELQQRISRNHPCALINATPQWTVDALLDEAQRQFTRALSTMPDLERAAAAVLIVDDAHTLSDMALQVLLTPVAGQAGQVRVLLSGAPELEPRISTTPEVKVLDLPAFSLADTERFLRSRLSGVYASILTPDNLQRIYQNSGGWPAGIIAQSRIALVGPAARPPRTSPVPKKKADPPPPPPRKKSPPKAGFLLRIARQTVNSYWFWPTLGIASVALLFNWPSIPENPLNPAPKAESTPQIPTPVPVIRPRAPLPQPIEEPAELAPIPSAPPLPPTVELPEPPPAPPPVTPPPIIPVPPVAPPAPHTPPVLYSEQWLRIQTPQDFTLQLSGGNTDDQLRQLIRDLKLDEGFIAHTLRNGRDWYLLLYGVYPTRRQAEIALQHLPPSINKPWIRTIGSVQKDLQ